MACKPMPNSVDNSGRLFEYVWRAAKERKVVVYDHGAHDLYTNDEAVFDNSKSEKRILYFSNLTSLDEKYAYCMDLPRWRNRVNLNVDPDLKSLFLAEVRIDKIGWRKNWQRRLRINYTKIYVKGPKPRP